MITSDPKSVGEQRMRILLLESEAHNKKLSSIIHLLQRELQKQKDEKQELFFNNERLVQRVSELETNNRELT